MTLYRRSPTSGFIETLNYEGSMRAKPTGWFRSRTYAESRR